MKVSVQVKTTKEALEDWDNNEIVWTIEMGGLGPGYEQCIHIAAMELIRKILSNGLPRKDKNLEEKLDKMLHAATANMGLGLSGAQAGAAKQIAYKACKLGWTKMLASIPEDRKIMVTKCFPSGN